MAHVARAELTPLPGRRGGLTFQITLG